MKYFLENKEEWKMGSGAPYMNELTRKQASLTFKARTRMIKVKCNYKNGYANLKCRMCKNEDETQKHIPEECPIIHDNESIRVPVHQLFNEDTDTLRRTAQKIDKVLQKLGDTVC